MIPNEIIENITEQFRIQITDYRGMGGGCIHKAFHVQSLQGSFFLKWNSIDQGHNFKVEAKGLELLRSAGSIHVPRVIGNGEFAPYAFLILEFIEGGQKTEDYWENFGAALASLHSNSQDLFGLTYDNYIGALPQPNGQQASWPDFFREKRLEPMLIQAEKKGLIGTRLRHAFENLYLKLDTFFPQDIPALIHGDLWGGNYVANSNGQVVIFDPAVYYGHREIELAFMTMFDSIPPPFYQSYSEVFPLESGYTDRFDLYNLYPLLVHVNLFGQSYLPSIDQILLRYI